jgi:hypothetical protein
LRGFDFRILLSKRWKTIRPCSIYCDARRDVSPMD